MFFKLWIIVAALLAVAYAAAIDQPLDLTALENQSQDVRLTDQHVREKRFILAKKAFLLGGAAGLGIGLAKGAYFAHHRPVYVYHSYPVHSYPVYSYPVYPSYGYGGGGGWSSAHAYASAGASSW